MSLSYFPKFFSFTFVKFESRKISKKGSRQCNVIKTFCTAAIKNTGMNLKQSTHKLKEILLLPELLVFFLIN